MSEASRPKCLIPFAQQYRASGVLVHITSLPSPYGIGDVGPTAFAMVDRLQAAGQSWWQALPLGPTGYIRLASLMDLPVLHIWTHDSICIGEDGPTHQPIEQLISCARSPGWS